MKDCIALSFTVVVIGGVIVGLMSGVRVEVKGFAVFGVSIKILEVVDG